MSTTICEDRLSSHAMNVGSIEDEGRRLEEREEMEGVEVEMVAYCNVEYKKRLFVAAIWESAHVYRSNHDTHSYGVLVRVPACV